MNAKSDTPTIPSWIHAMGVATWVSDHAGTVIYMNERAEQLLGRDPSKAIGRPCYEVIAGRTPDGEEQCKQNCRIGQLAREGQEIEPYTLRINDDEGEEHWLQMLVIPYEGGDGNIHKAHCAFRIDRSHIIESYLDRVAARTPVNKHREFNLEESFFASEPIADAVMATISGMIFGAVWG